MSKNKEKDKSKMIKLPTPLKDIHNASCSVLECTRGYLTFDMKIWSTPQG